MSALEKINPSLKGVLLKDYARPALNAVALGEPVEPVSGPAGFNRANCSRRF